MNVEKLDDNIINMTSHSPPPSREDIERRIMLLRKILFPVVKKVEVEE